MKISQNCKKSTRKVDLKSHSRSQKSTWYLMADHKSRLDISRQITKVDLTSHGRSQKSTWNLTADHKSRLEISQQITKVDLKSHGRSQKSTWNLTADHKLCFDQTGTCEVPGVGHRCTVTSLSGCCLPPYKTNSSSMALSSICKGKKRSLNEYSTWTLSLACELYSGFCHFVHV